MSTSAFTNFLAKLRQPAPPEKSGNGAPPLGQLIGMPKDVAQEVQSSQKPVRLQGRVVKTDRADIVRVETPRGAVEFKLAEGQAPPPEGKTVEVEILPPKTSTNSTAPNSGYTYRQVAISVQTPEAALPRSSATPVEITVQPARPDQPQSPAPEGDAPVPARPQTSTPDTPQPPLPSQPADIQPPTPQPQKEGVPAPDAIIRLIALSAATMQTIAPFTPVETIEAAPYKPASPLASFTLAPNTAPAALQSTLLTAPSQAPPLALLAFSSPAAIFTAPAPADPSALPADLAAPPAPALTSAAPDFFLLTFAQPAPLGFPPTAAPGLISQSALPAPEAGLLSQSALATPFALPTSLTTTLPLTTALPPEIANPVAGSKPFALPVNFDAQIAAAPISHHAPFFEGNALKGPRDLMAQNPQSLITLNQNAGALTGVVTNISAGQLPVLSVFFPQNGAEHSFLLQFPTADLRVGTSLQIMPQSSAAGAPAHSLPELMPLGFQLTPQPWPLMEEILHTITQTNPPAAQALTNLMPSPSNPVHMAPALLFFVAAVRGGDLTQWLGDKAVDALRANGKTSLLSRLLGESTQMSRLAADPVAPEWRAVNVPMHYQGDIQKLALFYRNEYEAAEGDEHGKRLKGTRFVFDLTLDAMGAVQVDGLYRPVSESGQRLDLVLRTQDYFSQATQTEMRRVYARGLRDTGVTGELSFQTKADFWVSIQAQQEHFAAQA